MSQLHGTGPNQLMPAAQLLHVLGSDNVAQFAGKLNVNCTAMWTQINSRASQGILRFHSSHVNLDACDVKRFHVLRQDSDTDEACAHSAQ